MKGCDRVVMYRTELPQNFWGDKLFRLCPDKKGQRDNKLLRMLVGHLSGHPLLRHNTVPTGTHPQKNIMPTCSSGLKSMVAQAVPIDHAVSALHPLVPRAGFRMGRPKAPGTQPRSQTSLAVTGCRSAGAAAPLSVLLFSLHPVLPGWCIPVVHLCRTMQTCTHALPLARW
jgi:hypothetical protein